MKKRTCLFLILIWIFANPALPRSLRKDLQISLKETRIENFGYSGHTLVFYINISNSHSKSYYFSSYNYRFAVNQREYFRLKRILEEKVEITAKKDTLLSFPLKITYANLFRVLEDIEKEDKAQCNLSGAMTFSDEKREKGKIHFAFSGEFPIFKGPEVEFLSLLVKDLTIGGADLGFSVRLKNKNPFELLIKRISYKLYIDENPIGEGIIKRGKNIDRKGEEVFSFPFLLNFFDVRKEVYDILHRPSTFCRFSGEIEVQTEWGKIKIPFDKTNKVSISRTP